MDKHIDYAKIRKKYKMTYKANQNKLEDEDEIPSQKKSLRKYLSKVELKHNVIDYSAKYGRGIETNQNGGEEDDFLKKEKTTFNKVVDVDRYYLQ